MQKIATQVFIYSSITFGVLGIIIFFLIADNDTGMFQEIVMRTLGATVFIILSSFAVSIAGKFLQSRSR